MPRGFFAEQDALFKQGSATQDYRLRTEMKATVGFGMNNGWYAMPTASLWKSSVRGTDITERKEPRRSTAPGSEAEPSPDGGRRSPRFQRAPNGDHRLLAVGGAKRFAFPGDARAVNHVLGPSHRAEVGPVGASLSARKGWRPPRGDSKERTRPLGRPHISNHTMAKLNTADRGKFRPGEFRPAGRRYPVED